MRLSRILSLALPIVAALVLVAAQAQQTTPPTSAPATPPPPLGEPPVANDDATRALDDAIADLDRQKLLWIDTTLWQQFDLHGLSFQARGRYVVGPEQRLHLDLELDMAGNTGSLQVFCDGVAHVETIQIGQAERLVRSKLDLTKLKPYLEGDNPPQLRDEFFQAHLFQGIVPLMRSLRHHLVCTSIEKSAWNGKNVTVVTGTWSLDTQKHIAGDPPTPWPAYVPRQCRIFLDAASHWPHRLEWRGPAPHQADDSLLVQMEFRDPKLNRPPAPEHCAALFTFDPSTARQLDKSDRTDLQARHLAERAKQLKGKQ
jgi:hypothetical protein